MYGGTSWAICGPSMQLEQVRAEVLAIPGMFQRTPGETPVFNGTLNDFGQHWGKQFTVHPEGAYITI